MKRIIVVVLTVAMVISTPYLSVYADAFDVGDEVTVEQAEEVSVPEAIAFEEATVATEAEAFVEETAAPEAAAFEEAAAAPETVTCEEETAAPETATEEAAIVPEAVQEEETVSVNEITSAKEEAEEKETLAEEPEESYPAQTLAVTAADGARITVNAPEGAFPAGSYVTANPVPEEYVLPLLENAEHAAAYDITVYDADGNEVQPKKAVKVSMANTGLSDADAVYHINDSMTKASLVTEDIDQASDAFTVSHFSIYTITWMTSSTAYFNGSEVTSLTMHVGDTVSLSSSNVSSSTGDPGDAWHVLKGDSNSPEPSEGLSWDIGYFQNKGGWPTADWYYSYITITALKPGVYLVENWSDKVDEVVRSVRITVKAQYTVTFDMNGHGAAPASQTIDDGNTATKPADPTEEGYIFIGWYENAECTGDAFDFSTAITAEKILYAKWIKSYTVTFKDEDGTVLKGPTEYAVGTKASDIEKPNDPTKTEETVDYVYRFAGWTPTIADVTQDAIYTATYSQVPKYRIHYEKNYFFADGTIEIPNDQVVVSGEPANVANNPVGGNPYFIAWNTAADGSGTRYHLHEEHGGQKTITLESNITLYAEWEYSIYFNPNGGNLKDIDQKVVFTNPNNQKIPSGGAEREGCEFLGWSTDSNATQAEYTAGSSYAPTRFSTTLYAVWKIDEYQITYDLDGGSLEAGKTNPDTYTVETETFTLNNPVKDGFQFQGWIGTGLDSASKTVSIAKGSTSDREYKATWKRLENYSLNVTMIEAGEQAIASSVNEASGKTTVFGTNWVIDESSLNTLKQYWARESQDTPTYFRDKFEQGGTYYSVALVQFPVDEDPDPARVTLNETNDIKQVGQMAVHRDENNESENVVIVPFSVTIPYEEYTITYNLDGGKLEEGQTNPAKYTSGTESFTLNNPVKEGYKFMGWTGSDLTAASKSVTIVKGSTGDRTYTATWEKLDTYSLDVTLIHAGVQASTADVEEADDKISIATTSWVSSQSDVDALKAYFADPASGSAPASFRDYFQAGETYYSVAFVTFADDEEPDASRVKLNTNEYVKTAGDPVVRESENQLIIPFSVTIPAITVTVEFGSNHAALAEQVAAAAPEGFPMTASGGTLTYKAEKGSDRWFNVTSPLREALHGGSIDGSKPDNGEMMFSGFVVYNLKPLDSYKDAEACSADMDIAMESEPQNEDLKLYILWTKPTGVTLTITRPVCGTEVTLGSDNQDPRPEIKVTGGNADIHKVNDGDFSYDPTYWITGEDMNAEPFTGTMTGGSTYRAMTMLVPDFAYFIDPAKITVENGTLVDLGDNYRPGSPIFIDVEAEHDWDDWKVNKEPTTTEAGEEQHTCKYCDETETRVIPKINEYTISFDLGGGTLDGKTGIVTQRIEEGSTITMPEPSREGYKFLYWKGSEYYAGDSYTVTEDHTFTAQWEKIATTEEESKTAVTNKENKAATPKTGDDTNVALWSILLLCALIAMIAVYKRKTEE